MFEIIPNWHPLFVHFTVALVSLATGLFAVTPFMKSPLKEQSQTVARWNSWFGAGFTIITGLAGLYAYNTVVHDTPSHAAMTEHRNWAIVTITLIPALAIWSIIRVRRNQALGPVFIAAMVITGGVLAATAWQGGEVVYRYGLGVMSLPKTEGAGHAHEHADEAGHEPSGNIPTTEMTATPPLQAWPMMDLHHPEIRSTPKSIRTMDTPINSNNPHHANFLRVRSRDLLIPLLRLP